MINLSFFSGGGGGEVGEEKNIEKIVFLLYSQLPDSLYC